MTRPRRQRPGSPLQHPWFARAYSLASRWLDERGGSDHRRRLLAPLSGKVIEVGAGNGRNFAHYPTAVTSVLAVEPESRLRGQALRAAPLAPVPVGVVSARAEQLPVADDRFDGAVLSLVLCSIADPGHALAELRRVVRPGGVVRFYEHVRSPRASIGMVQDAVTPVWSFFAGGCHLNRDSATTIDSAPGFEVTELDRFSFAGVTHVLGTAR
jgi:ubiquinone/menaquinone biosynthesis C-methylase UbiE